MSRYLLKNKKFKNKIFSLITMAQEELYKIQIQQTWPPQIFVQKKKKNPKIFL